MHTRTGIVVLCSGSALGFVAFQALGAMPTPDGVRRSVVQRHHMERQSYEAPGVMRGVGPAVYPNEFRTIDGSGNNPNHPLWGAAANDMMRMMPAAYPVGAGEIPARADGPSARAVSNAVCATDLNLPNSVNASDFLWQWGQFLDHDLDETPVVGVPFDIPVPAGDPFFDPDNTGTAVIGLDRSAYHIDFDGNRQQISGITAFHDASNVYGSDLNRTMVLRANDGTGRLATGPGDLLPYNTTGLPNAPVSFDSRLFVAGDIRSNEQVCLTAMHTLFMREHNYWCQQLAAQFPDASGDELFERARAIVAAEEQAITMNEFIPVLLGADAMGPYPGYDPSMVPMVSNEFATAAFRMGHTMLPSSLKRLHATDTPAFGGDLPLRDGFFSSTEIATFGIDALLRGLASQPAQAIDTLVVDDVRNFLFGPPGSTGFDLASLNIQRGRDHGIPDYNSLRELMGFPRVTSFDQISADPAINAGLASVYESVDDIDPWVGLLAEPPVGDAMVGETLRAIMIDQFTRMRAGDRFWYESYLPSEMVDMVNQQTLAVIIRRNTGIGAELSDDVFHAVAPCPADVNNDGVINFFDISAFLSAFANREARVDYNANDGVFDFFDVTDFISYYNAGCP